MASMIPDSSPELSSYRVTLFYGPEPVQNEPGVHACVFNVKKRSWRAGIQVSVEVRTDQIERIRNGLHVDDRLALALETAPPGERSTYEARVPDLFAQAVSWCKLNLRLRSGVPQENQRVRADELIPELDLAVAERREYVMTYILNELDLTSGYPSPSSR